MASQRTDQSKGPLFILALLLLAGGFFIAAGWAALTLATTSSTNTATVSPTNTPAPEHPNVAVASTNHAQTDPEVPAPTSSTDMAQTPGGVKSPNPRPDSAGTLTDEASTSELTSPALVNSVDRPNPADSGTLAALVPATTAWGAPIEVVDPERFLQVPVLRNPGPIPASTRLEKDGNRLRFHCPEDYVSLLDNMAIPGTGDISMSFELEFAATDNQQADVTAVWGSDPVKSTYHGPIAAAWSGYEAKLGGPNRGTMKHKRDGYPITVAEHSEPRFVPGVAHQVEIQQIQGRVNVLIDGVPVLQSSDTNDPMTPGGANQHRGFGLLLYRTSGWIGPITMRAPTGKS